ncbi:ROK family protein [Homoserinimonas sp. A447]
MGVAEVHGYSRASELFQLLRDGKEKTRTELAQISGLARTTVSSRVDELMQLGLVTAANDAPSTGGRPSSQFSFDPAARVVLAVDVSSDHVSVAVTDLQATVLQHDQRPLKLSDGPSAVLTGAMDMGEQLLQDLDMSTDLVIGVGVGLAGYVEITTGRQATLPTLAKWTSSVIQEQIQRSFAVPVLVDNDVNVMALGEQLMYSGVDDLMFVKLTTGIGAGIIAGGSLQKGCAGMAGGVGHARVPRGHDIICRCGNAGCLEAVASVTALVKTLRDKGHDVTDAADIVRLVEQENADAVQALRQAGRDLGSVLAVYASVLNPSLIAVGGPLAMAGEHLLAETRKTVHDQASPMVTESLTIVRASTPDTTAVVGASRMVIEHVLSPKGIEDMLTSPTATLATA